MANGRIRFGKQSGGQLALVIPDGVTNTDLVLPESGTVATKQYVDTRINEGVGQLSTDAYQGPYGISWDYTTDTYIRTGAKGYTAIQSMMRRCVVRAEARELINTLEAELGVL